MSRTCDAPCVRWGSPPTGPGGRPGCGEQLALCGLVVWAGLGLFPLGMSASGGLVVFFQVLLLLGICKGLRVTGRGSEPLFLITTLFSLSPSHFQGAHGREAHKEGLPSSCGEGGTCGLAPALEGPSAGSSPQYVRGGSSAERSVWSALPAEGCAAQSGRNTERTASDWALLRIQTPDRGRRLMAADPFAVGKQVEVFTSPEFLLVGCSCSGPARRPGLGLDARVCTMPTPPPEVIAQHVFVNTKHSPDGLFTFFHVFIRLFPCR